MTGQIVLYAGAGLAAIGIAMLALCIRRATAIRSAGLAPAALDAELRKLILWNAASVGLGFLGLAVMVIGIIL